MFFFFFFLSYSLYLLKKTKNKQHNSLRSQGGVDDLAHEEDVLRGAINDEDHERAIEPEDRDRLEGQQHYSDARGGRSRGAGLVHVQGSLVHHLWLDGSGRFVNGGMRKRDEKKILKFFLPWRRLI